MRISKRWVISVFVALLPEILGGDIDLLLDLGEIVSPHKFVATEVVVIATTSI